MFRIWDNYHEEYVERDFDFEEEAWQRVDDLCKEKKSKGLPFDYDVDEVEN